MNGSTIVQVNPENGEQLRRFGIGNGKFYGQRRHQPGDREHRAADDKSTERGRRAANRDVLHGGNGLRRGN
jgi:hypothetical protein